MSEYDLKSQNLRLKYKGIEYESVKDLKKANPLIKMDINFNFPADLDNDGKKENAVKINFVEPNAGQAEQSKSNGLEILPLDTKKPIKLIFDGSGSVTGSEEKDFIFTKGQVNIDAGKGNDVIRSWENNPENIAKSENDGRDFISVIPDDKNKNKRVQAGPGDLLFEQNGKKDVAVIQDFFLNGKTHGEAVTNAFKEKAPDKTEIYCYDKDDNSWVSYDDVEEKWEKDEDLNESFGSDFSSGVKKLNKDNNVFLNVSSSATFDSGIAGEISYKKLSQLVGIEVTPQNISNPEISNKITEKMEKYQNGEASKYLDEVKKWNESVAQLKTEKAKLSKEEYKNKKNELQLQKPKLTDEADLGLIYKDLNDEEVDLSSNGIQIFKPLGNIGPLKDKPSDDGSFAPSSLMTLFPKSGVIWNTAAGVDSQEAKKDYTSLSQDEPLNLSNATKKLEYKNRYISKENSNTHAVASGESEKTAGSSFASPRTMGFIMNKKTEDTIIQDKLKKDFFE